MSKSVISGITPLSKQPFCAIDPQSADAWGNPKGEERMREIVLALIDAGYKGIGFQATKISGEETLCHFEANNLTPEGAMFNSILEHVKRGGLPPTVNQCINEIKNEYEFFGLIPPVDSSKNRGAK